MSNMPERIWAGLDRPTGFNDSDMDKLNMWSETFLASDTEYIRADVANAEIDMLRKALGTAGERINAQEAEIERLKKALDDKAARVKFLEKYFMATLIRFVGDTEACRMWDNFYALEEK